MRIYSVIEHNLESLGQKMIFVDHNSLINISFEDRKNENGQSLLKIGRIKMDRVSDMFMMSVSLMILYQLHIF
jgi:hypothetical protein